MRRGWTTPYKYLAESTQRKMLMAAGVEDRGAATPIYKGREEWPTFIQALRYGDEAVVADLRIFGSRKALGKATAEVEARKAVLVAAVRDVRIDPPTLREAHETERRWAGERSMGGSKRARLMSAKANAARKELIAAARMPAVAAKAIWRDIDGYPLRREAIAAMKGWTVVTAWRTFGKRPVKRDKK